ncbi:hypothetical protein BH24ACT11_BH24ACT11_07860 [soil metagenome]
MALGLGAALLSAVVFGSAAMLQASGARQVPTARHLDPWMLVRLLRQPAFVAAVLCNIAGFLLHLVAIRELPLFLAQAAIAISLAITALLAVRIFGDPLTAPECAAVAAVCVGLALLTAASGQTGGQSGAGPLPAGMLAGLLVVAGLGAVAARSPGGLATSVLSASAGVCFATTAIAARLLPALSPAAVLTAPAAYLLLAAGPMGFLLYSVALQRGAVTAATAPMIVIQTAVPALLGVWVLGDAIRAGWHLPVAVGLVCTLVGAVSLARYDGLRTQSRAADGRLTRQ